MALAQYTDVFWFPSGVLAASVPARVFPVNSNGLASLYTDVTGTTPLSNPLNTDASGVLTFWAEEGEYWIHIDTESFRVSVGSPNIDLFEAASVSLSTGLVSGGAMSVNANPALLDISAMVGWVVDDTTDAVRPTATRVSLPNQTVALTDVVNATTWWMVDASGTVIQQSDRPTDAQRREFIQLGVTGQNLGAIFRAISSPVILAQPMNQLYDLMYSVAPFRKDGSHLSPNGANLKFNKTAGNVFSPSFSHGTTPRDPHIFGTAAQTPVTFRHFTQVAVSPLPPFVTDLDVANYDVGGVVTPIGGGSGRSTIKYVYLLAVSTVQNQVLIQYGQTVYNTLSEAVNAVGSEVRVVNPDLAQSASLIGYIVTTRTATNLSDPTQALIIRAAKFAE